MAVYAITLVAALVGLLAGFFLGMNGFSQTAKAGALGQLPRMKNLLWLFSGLFSIFIADFKKLGFTEDFPWVWPFVGYGVCAIVTAIGAVWWMVHSITGTVKSFNAHHAKALSLDPGPFQREYLTYGKAKYEELWANA